MSKEYPHVSGSIPAPDTSATFASQWYLVFVLTVIYILKFVDSGVMTVVVNPIKADLGISDVQMSLLLGLAFVSLFSVLTVPAGFLVDLYSRRALLCLAVLFWSAMAVLCGLSNGYWQFFAARVGLGVGEAMLPPAAYSLLRDGVAFENRGRAFSIYQSGLVLGGGLGALVAGWLFTVGLSDWFARVPMVGNLKPWQLVIVGPGLVGILLAPLLLTIKEPIRCGDGGIARSNTLLDAVRHFKDNWRVYAPIFGAITTISMAGGGAWNAWLVAAIGRTWPLSTAQIGKTVGAISLIFFPASTYLSGYVMDYFKKRGYQDSTFYVALSMCLLNVIPAILIIKAMSPAVMWSAYGFSVFFGTSSVQIACGVTLATVTPSALMGKMSAFYYLIANLLGQAFGVSCIAFVAQHLFAGSYALSNSLLLCYSVAMVLTITFLIMGISESRRWRSRPAPI
jgi:MFS family permease